MNEIIMVAVLTALVFVIAIPLTISKVKKINRLYQQGVIVKRSICFAEKGEELTALVGGPKYVAQILSRLDVGCSISGDAASEVNFKGKCFAAKLCLSQFDPRTGRACYRFYFTRFQEKRGVYRNSVGMNMLMTAIEKTFLSLDPNTTARSFDLGFKRRPSFF